MTPLKCGRHIWRLPHEAGQSKVRGFCRTDLKPLLMGTQWKHARSFVDWSLDPLMQDNECALVWSASSSSSSFSLLIFLIAFPSQPLLALLSLFVLGDHRGPHLSLPHSLRTHDNLHTVIVGPV